MPPELTARFWDWLPDWYVNYLVGVIVWIFRLDYGNVQEFITWMVAGVALIFAAKAASAAGRTNELQDAQITQLRADQLSRDEEKRREQAECVGAWCDTVEAVSRFGRGSMTFYDRRALVLNSSRLPVYIASIYTRHPTYEKNRLVGLSQRRAVPPSSQPVEFSLPGIKGWNQERQSLITDVGIYFTDTGGRFWHRDPYGKLSELDEDEFFQERSNLEAWWEESKADAEAELADQRAIEAETEAEAKAEFEASRTADDSPPSDTRSSATPADNGRE